MSEIILEVGTYIYEGGLFERGGLIESLQYYNGDLNRQ